MKNNNNNKKPPEFHVLKFSRNSDSKAFRDELNLHMYNVPIPTSSHIRGLGNFHGGSEFARKLQRRKNHVLSKSRSFCKETPWGLCFLFIFTRIYLLSIVKQVLQIILTISFTSFLNPDGIYCSEGMRKLGNAALVSTEWQVRDIRLGYEATKNRTRDLQHSDQSLIYRVIQYSENAELGRVVTIDIYVMNGACRTEPITTDKRVMNRASLT